MDNSPLNHKQAQQTSAAGFLLFFGVLFGGIPGIAGVGLFASGEIFPAFFTLFFVLIGCGVFILGFKMWLAERLLKDVGLQTPRPYLHLGETFPVRFVAVAKKDFRASKVTFTLKLTESATRRRGTKSTTFTEDRFVQTFVFDQGQHFTSGMPLAYETELKIDPAGPASFAGKRNKLAWSLTAAIDVPGWPDPEYTWPLEVEPVLRFEDDGEGYAEELEEDDAAAG